MNAGETLGQCPHELALNRTRSRRRRARFVNRASRKGNDGTGFDRQGTCPENGRTAWWRPAWTKKELVHVAQARGMGGKKDIWFDMMHGGTLLVIRHVVKCMVSLYLMDPIMSRSTHCPLVHLRLPFPASLPNQACPQVPTFVAVHPAPQHGKSWRLAPWSRRAGSWLQIPLRSISNENIRDRRKLTLLAAELGRVHRLAHNLQSQRLGVL